MRMRHAATAVVLACCAAGAMTVAWINEDDAGPSGETVPGVAAAMHFTDAQGNPRTPSDEERAALAAAFQEDLAELTRGKRIPENSWRTRSGATAAVAGIRRLEYLTVTVGDDGVARYSHRPADSAVQGDIAPTNDLPEM